MDRSRLDLSTRWLIVALLVTTLLPSTGCGRVLATMVYAWNGGNTEPADFAGLESKRVVVLCRPPSSLGFRHPHVDRQLARLVSDLLAERVGDIEVVDHKQVDHWADAGDADDFRDLAKSVDAEMVVHIELEDFDLNKGSTLYQGRSEVNISVYDMENDGKKVWEESLGEIIFPATGGIPTAEKSPKQFRKQYLAVLSQRIARHFYEHDPYFDFALDSTAHSD